MSPSLSARSGVSLGLMGPLLLAVVVFSHSAQSQSSCGGSCRTLNDCSGVLICINGKCADDPDVGSHVCTGTSKSPPPSAPRKASPPAPPPPSPKASPPPLPSPKVSLPSPTPPKPTPTPSPPPVSPTCKSTGVLMGTASSSSFCTTENMSECCVAGKAYPTYTCSPPVTKTTPAVLTLNNFSLAGDGGGPGECSGQYYDGSTQLVVALSTGWYNGGSRCNKNIRITAKNGRSVLAKVVDECDSRAGCDSEHAGQPPCIINDVDASDAVWAALGYSQSDPLYGMDNITWSDV